MARRRVELAPEARRKVREARGVVDGLDRAVPPRHIYGINTGFGALSEVRISPHDVRRLQQDLLREPCVRRRTRPPGARSPRNDAFARPGARPRASGVREIIVDRLGEMLNANVIRAHPGRRVRSAPQPTSLSRPPRAGADGRRRSDLRRSATPGRRSPRKGSACPRNARGQRGARADQRYPVHGGARCAVSDASGETRNRGRHRELMSLEARIEEPFRSPPHGPSPAPRATRKRF